MSSNDRFPRQVRFIIGNEIAERFSYYGMMGILELYLVQRMRMGEESATQTLHLFGTAVYFLPLAGGWLADRWLGRYWTILSISLVYCLGHLTLALFEGSPTGLLVGLGLIAIGAGGIKPCVSAFVGDQFGPEQKHLLTRVYGWFYWAINVGSASAFLTVPRIHEAWGYRWAFGVPGLAMGLATVIFWTGTKYYVRRPAMREEGRVRFLPVVWHGLTHWKERRPGHHFLDSARGHFSAVETEGAKRVLSILMIFATVPMFWALFNQVNSTWVLQGKAMQPFLPVNGNYLLNGETMQGAGAILVMIWVPIFTWVVYPFLERVGLKPTALRRMSAGMVLGALAFFISGFLQAYLDRGRSLSIVWQLVPYVVLEAGEVLLSATALEFAFAQAPAPYKSTIMSVWLMTIAGGHFLIAVFTNLNARFVKAKGASEFYFYAVLMLVVAGIFIFCARRYREQSPASEEGLTGVP